MSVKFWESWKLGVRVWKNCSYESVWEVIGVDRKWRDMVFCLIFVSLDFINSEDVDWIRLSIGLYLTMCFWF